MTPSPHLRPYTPDDAEAVAAVIAEGKARTYDMGGKTKLSEMAKAVADKV